MLKVNSKTFRILTVWKSEFNSDLTGGVRDLRAVLLELPPSLVLVLLGTFPRGKEEEERAMTPTCCKKRRSSMNDIRMPAIVNRDKWIFRLRRRRWSSTHSDSNIIANQVLDDCFHPGMGRNVVRRRRGHNLFSPFSYVIANQVPVIGGMHVPSMTCFCVFSVLVLLNSLFLD